MIRRVIGVGLKIYMSDDPEDYYVDYLNYFVNVDQARAYVQELREEFPAGEVFCGSFIRDCCDDLKVV